MRSKPIALREEARRDIDDAIAYYLEEGAAEAALGFVHASEQAYAHISRHPATGSPRHAHELSLPGLRSWPLARYPYLIFYVEHDHTIDVWRIAHGKRDIPAWMQDPDAS
ncbi:type II toxin-antitoxin system RelE/ParE family toxin [Inquilinus sp.]|uniref:type II toxin-antitoxin system RelE/ParE family toxin n=1 Tax=Inquilinus sp. TaxID=1932117 RepID=UPI0031D66439